MLKQINGNDDLIAKRVLSNIITNFGANLTFCIYFHDDNDVEQYKVFIIERL